MSFVIKNLKAKVDDKLVLNEVNLELDSSQLAVLMGQNGSGKTSLGFVVAGHPDYQIVSGAITLDGQDLLKLTPDKRAKIGFFLAFQHPITVEGITYQKFLWQVYKKRFIQTPPKSGKRIESITEFKEHLLKLATELKIPGKLLNRSLNLGFSGGEKKRLEMLQLILLEPKYAILDEIDSGLDIDAVKLVAQSIKHVVSQFGTGILLITHYRRILNYIKPDKVSIMSKGKIIIEGGFELVDKLEKEGYTHLA